MFGLAVEPKARGDEQKISGSLQKIADEDPTFKVTRDSQTKEMVITGMSQLHLDIVKHRLKTRFDLEIISHEPKIPYRETITSHAEASHRHKKQSGGRGQFGEVHLRVYHLPRDIHSRGRTAREVRQQVEIREDALGPLRSGAQLRVHRHHRRRHHSQPVRPGGGKRLQGTARTRRLGRLSHPGRRRRSLLRQGPPGR